MLAGLKTLDTQNNCLTVILSEDEDLEDHSIDGYNREAETGHLLA
jgi:hypothetical protein